jgi:hypothetical protein
MLYKFIPYTLQKKKQKRKNRKNIYKLNLFRNQIFQFKYNKIEYLKKLDFFDSIFFNQVVSINLQITSF